MLVFIDESYRTDASGTIQHVIGGIAIEDFRYRFLEAGLHRIKKTHLHSRDGMTQEEVRPFMAEKVLVNGDPEQHELKGEDLLQNRRLRMHAAETPSPSVLLVEECLQLLVACRCATFGVLSSPGPVDEI